MHKFQMYMKRGHLGRKALPIMVNNELKALWSNKQIIYSSLLSPILYFLFYSVGIQSTFGDISFNGTTVSFLSYSLIGIFAMSLFKEMYQCVYRMIIDKRWGLLSLDSERRSASHLYPWHCDLSHRRCCHSIGDPLSALSPGWRILSTLPILHHPCISDDQRALLGIPFDLCGTFG